MNIFPWSWVTKNLDPNVTNALVFVHGFNVTSSDATGEFGEAYKRAYWQGFRGNFIGFSWYGDPPPVVSSTGNGSPLSPANFDGAVQNALETAGTFLNFVQVLETPNSAGGEGIPANNVNVMAHSLGNLVVWDALRIEKALGGSPVINNLVDVESAVWADAFTPLTPITLPSPPAAPTALTVQDLRIDSWLGYFVPTGGLGSTTLGNVINSYYGADGALQLERDNDFLFNGTDKAHPVQPPTFAPPVAPAPPRDDTNLWNTPSIWSEYWNEHDSNVSVGRAIGMMQNPAANVNVDASLYGWGNADSTDPLHHSDFLDEPYPDIYAWWQTILARGVPVGQQRGM
jgi:hypothetical protein